MLIEGKEETPGPLARTLNEYGYELPPLPNLFFTRDVGDGVGRHVLVGSMRYGIRWSEELIMKALFLYHPMLRNEGILYDGSIERRLNYTLEGGDVHPLRRGSRPHRIQRTLEPGSDRSSRRRAVRARRRSTDIIVVVMPKENTAIHLDMIFTQVDRELCVCLPAALHRRRSGSRSCTGTRGRRHLREMPRTSLPHSPTCGMPMSPCSAAGSGASCRIASSGPRGATSWRCGPGSCCRTPGTSARSSRWRSAGFRIVTAANYLTGDARIADDERAVITFEGCGARARGRRSAVHDAAPYSETIREPGRSGQRHEAGAVRTRHG